MARGIRQDEQALVARANAGDREAIGELYAMHEQWVARVAMRYTKNADDAEDVKHETFMYLMSKFPGFELRSTMRGFLFPAVRHKSISIIRRRKRTAALGDHEPVAPGEIDAGDFERLIGQLPDHEREVVERRFRDGMALAEIAEALGIPVGTVKSRLHKAIARLRERLQHRWPERIGQLLRDRAA